MDRNWKYTRHDYRQLVHMLEQAALAADFDKGDILRAKLDHEIQRMLIETELAALGSVWDGQAENMLDDSPHAQWWAVLPHEDCGADEWIVHNSHTGRVEDWGLDEETATNMAEQLNDAERREYADELRELGMRV